MDISVSQMHGNVPVTVIKLDGQLDGQNYQDLIVKARDLHQAGTRDFVLDLSGISYISSAGLVALHSIALLVKGEDLPDPEHGWAAYRSVKRTSVAGVHAHVKLYNPSQEVKNILNMVGFSDVFAIFDDLDDAVKSF